MNANPTRHPTAATAPAAANRLDTAIEWASGATAVGMFAYGYALSYSVLHAIAVAVGLPAWAARVWPLGFESFMASAALNALAEQRHRRHLTSWWQRVPWYPWTLTGLTAGASLLLNWFHPAIPLDPPPGWLRSLVYGLPPLAAVFAWHLFLQRVTHRHTSLATSDTHPSMSDALADTTVQRLDSPSGADTPPLRPSSSDSLPPADSGTAATSAPPQAAGNWAGRPPEPATAHMMDTPAGGTVDTPASEGTEPSAADALTVKAPDVPAETGPGPSAPGAAMDTPGIQAADGAMDTGGVQPGVVSNLPAGGVRDRLAAAYTAGRPDGGAWTARTLAQAAGCGRSTAAAFLRQQRHATQQEAGGEGS